MSHPDLPIAPDQPWLAPLAGWSDLPFRLLCREEGAAVCCTEMVSARGILQDLRSRPEGRRGSCSLLATVPEDSPLVVQLFGDNPTCMGEAVRVLADMGYRHFDCNMGCSVAKVTRAGSGAALLRDPERARQIAIAMLTAARAAGTSVGFKLRLGWDADMQTGMDLAGFFADAGAAWVTLHPRTARQGFSGQADWTKIAELVQQVDVPVLASGDVLTAEDGIRCLRETGAAGVMYARGALHDPSIFARHRALYTGRVQEENDWREALHHRILRHAALAQRFGTPETALLKMRTSVPRYVRQMPGARMLRQQIIACRSWQDFEQVLNAFFAAAPDCSKDEEA